MANILIIEDEPVLAKSLMHSLRLGGHEAVTASTGEDGVTAVREMRPDLVLLDYQLPGINGLEALRQLREEGSAAAVVMMTAHGNIDLAVDAMKAGASDFITKPMDLKELDLVVGRTLTHHKAMEGLRYFRQRERGEVDGRTIIGQSKPMQAVRTFIERITSTPALGSDRPPSVLITGETGTGKDLAAKCLHYHGPRRDAAFVQVNCTAMPDHLVESELFGHIKGAFTDARSDKRGLFELADGGTVFLDEIGHMKPALQAKLLTVLENRTLRPVGSTKERRIDIHVIAATNRRLEEAISSDEFRADLYHRLRVLTLHMPPLRERDDDMIELADHFREVYSARFGVMVDGFSAEAAELLRAHDWPGNVRELMHTIESAVLITDGRWIKPEHLNVRPPAKSGGIGVDLPGAAKTVKFDFTDASMKLEDVENEVIRAALEYSKHNLSRAARILGISRDAVRYRLERYESRRGGEAPLLDEGGPGES